MKKLLTVLLALLMVLGLAACGGNNTEEPVVEAEGKVFNIWTWNEEFWGFLTKYYADEIIDETLSSVTSERTSRVIDKDGGAASMEKRKREGYF